MESFLQNLDNGVSFSQIIKLLESITQRLVIEESLCILTSIINNLQERRGRELEGITSHERFTWFKCFVLQATLYEERDNDIRRKNRRNGQRRVRSNYVITPGEIQRKKFTIRIRV